MTTCQEHSYGLILLYQDTYLLVHEKKGHWGFPKGHAEKGESPKETALRELKEECCIEEVRILPGISFSDEYVLGEGVCKKNEFFLGILTNNDVIVQEDEIQGYAFLSYEEARNRLTYETSREVLDQAHTYFCDTLTL